MEFNEKLQQLRKQNGYTQEELAEKLFVSRTAISKWESGRGLPNIESLKTISTVFKVTIDELLSADEIIMAAEEAEKERAVNLRSVLYSLFDLMNLILFFIPIFGMLNGGFVESVFLFEMHLKEGYIALSYAVIITVTVLFGILEIVLQNCQSLFWKKNQAHISIILSILATVMFMISQQPYIAFFEFWLLVIKGVLYIKQSR